MVDKDDSDAFGISNHLMKPAFKSKTDKRVALVNGKDFSSESSDLSLSDRNHLKRTEVCRTESSMEGAGNALMKYTPLTFYGSDNVENFDNGKIDEEDSDYYLIMNGLLDLQLDADPSLKAFEAYTATALPLEQRDDKETLCHIPLPTVSRRKETTSATPTVFMPIKKAPTDEAKIVVSPRAHRHPSTMMKSSPGYMPVDNTFIAPPMSLTHHPKSTRKKKGASFIASTYPRANSLNASSKSPSSTPYYNRMTALTTPKRNHLPEVDDEVNILKVPEKWIELYHNRPSIVDGQAATLVWMRTVLSMRRMPYSCETEGRTNDLGLSNL